MRTIFWSVTHLVAFTSSSSSIIEPPYPHPTIPTFFLPTTCLSYLYVPLALRSLRYHRLLFCMLSNDLLIPYNDDSKKKHSAVAVATAAGVPQEEMMVRAAASGVKRRLPHH